MRALKWFFRVMAAAMAAMMLFAAAAFAGTGDFSFTLNNAGDGYIVTGYSGGDTAVVVPDWYNGMPVTEIGDSAFEGNTAIKSVALSSFIERIGDSAFEDCTSLYKFSAYTAAAEPPVSDRIPGDANDSGETDIFDALLVMQYSAGWNVSLNKDYSDVDANGSITLNDALLILKYGAGQDVTLK